MKHPPLYVVGIALSALLVSAASRAQEHQHRAMTAPADTRQAIAFPEGLRQHTLGNMRDHLWALQQIQAALGAGKFDQASEIAEQRLGLSSLVLHGAGDVAPFMPQAMQNIGTEMHRAASRFAVEAVNAGASGDLRAALTALSAVTAQCVACHTAYRVQ